MILYFLIAILIFIKLKKVRESLKNLTTKDKNSINFMVVSIIFFVVAGLFSLVEILMGRKFHLGDVILAGLGIVLMLVMTVRDLLPDDEELKEKKKDRDREKILRLPRKELSGYIEKEGIDPREFIRQEKKKKSGLMPGEEDEIPGRINPETGGVDE